MRMSGLVKHYQNTMKGIPQLSNNWGAMINLLDAVLVNGFNHIPILGLTKANAESITATINLGSGHGFIDRQVVRIAGSTNGWDGDYKVLSADGASITVECTTEHQSVILGTATCFTAPLDFEIVHQTPAGSLEPKRAYRSTDPESLGLILLVHDFCSPGAAVTGAKFAKVGVASGMSDIDTIVGSQMPFDPANQNANWGWDGTYHGWAKWYYATANGIYSNTTVSDVSVPTLTSKGFFIVGSNQDGFVFNVNAVALQAGTGVSAAYGFLEFFDAKLNSKNLAMLCFGVGAKYAQNANLPVLGRGAIVPFGTSSDTGTLNNGNLKGFLWHGTEGTVQQTTMLKPPYLDVTTNTMILSDMLVLDSSGVGRGVLPFLRTTTKELNQSSYDSEFGKYANIFSHYDNSSATTRFALLLESI